MVHYFSWLELDLCDLPQRRVAAGGEVVMEVGDQVGFQGLAGRIVPQVVPLLGVVG